MNTPKSLKHLLLEIARLPVADQRRILSQLSIEQRATFNRFDGPALLKTAQRFCNLTAPAQATPDLPQPQEPIPACCELLAQETPLYAAVVLDQGTYSWTPLFLNLCDSAGAVRRALESQVPDLKPLVKKAIWAEWENKRSFDSYLEEADG